MLVLVLKSMGLEQRTPCQVFFCAYVWACGNCFSYWWKKKEKSVGILTTHQRTDTGRHVRKRLHKSLHSACKKGSKRAKNDRSSGAVDLENVAPWKCLGVYREVASFKVSQGFSLKNPCSGHKCEWKNPVAFRISAQLYVSGRRRFLALDQFAPHTNKAKSCLGRFQTATIQ